MSRTNLRRAEFDRSQQPGFLNQYGQPWRQGRRARVARLQPIERPRQVSVQPRHSTLKMIQDARQIGVMRFEQLDQVMLDLDVVVGPRKTQPRRPVKRTPAGVVEPADE